MTRAWSLRPRSLHANPCTGKRVTKQKLGANPILSKKKTHCFGAHSAKRYVSEVIYRKLLSITQKLALIKARNK
ncbi:hypothetical protein EFO71_07085 [Lacticaseibacillus rhamnosus]|nr:hypothetical protein [Lacticaseibacillus rhamnosus]MCT3178395.1 hypothetical protein [Lacticaseibacillus rhamnosus]MCT3183983.1 hypothetical protein [Lacticaseibacillus rhamnosus]MCT4449485.1 hypothetical protein [Lacticaseibacillus rhamnosus]